MKALFSRWLPAPRSPLERRAHSIFISGRVRDLSRRIPIGVLLAGVAMGLMALPSALPAMRRAARPGMRAFAPRARLGQGLTFSSCCCPSRRRRCFRAGFSGNLVKNRGMITDAAFPVSRAAAQRPPKPVELPLPTNDPPPSDTQAPAPHRHTASARWRPRDPIQRHANPPHPATPHAHPKAASSPSARPALRRAGQRAAQGLRDKPVELMASSAPHRNNAKGNRFKAVHVHDLLRRGRARGHARRERAKAALPEMSWVKSPHPGLLGRSWYNTTRCLYSTTLGSPAQPVGGYTHRAHPDSRPCRRRQAISPPTSVTAPDGQGRASVGCATSRSIHTSNADRDLSGQPTSHLNIGI